MAALAREMLSDAMQFLVNEDKKIVQHVQQKEDLVDALEKETTVYLAELSQHSLTQEQSQEMSALMHVVNDLERIGDHAQNIIQLAEEKSENRLPFSEQAIEELQEMYEKVDEMLSLSITAFEKNDLLLAGEVVDQDDVVDNLEQSLRQSHISRINEQICFPPSGVVFLDIISNLERIADHVTNFAQSVLENN
jgi:phosphate:Na+ symporter